MRQRRRPRLAISPDICVTFYAGRKTCSHLFTHCHVAQRLWSSLFVVLGELWVCTSTVMELLHIILWGSARIRTRRLYGVNCNAILEISWCIWLERNARTFSKLSLSVDALWEITYLASLWAKAAGVFLDYPISVFQKNWASSL